MRVIIIIIIINPRKNEGIGKYIIIIKNECHSKLNNGKAYENWRYSTNISFYIETDTRCGHIVTMEELVCNLLTGANCVSAKHYTIISGGLKSHTNDLERS